MRKGLKYLAGLVAGLALMLAALLAAVGREGTLSLILGPVEYAPVDFAALDPGDRPNRYLVCPVDLCGASADLVSPVYDEPATALRDRWMAMIAGQSRVTGARVTGAGVTGAGEFAEAMQYDFVQRSRLIGFPDTVTVKFIVLSESRSTLAIYSRSHYGYSDFGVNRRRVEAWLAQLSASPYQG